METITSSQGRNNQRRYILYFLVIFAASAIRFSYYGANYYYQLDDYIQYYTYPLGGWATIKSVGLLASRPLAGLMDVYFWGSLYEHMWFGVILLALLNTAATLIIFIVLRRHFNIGPFFLIVVCLLPMNFEGTYWVSAASRIVLAMFFCAASALSLQLYAERKQVPLACLFALFQLIAFGFYEQAIPLSITITVCLLFLNRKALGKRVWLGLWSLLAVGLYFGICSLPENNINASRSELVLPVSAYYFNTFLPNLLRQLAGAFLGGGFYITAKGFLRGLLIMLEDRAIIYALAVMGLTAAVAFVYIRHDRAPRHTTRSDRGKPAYLYLLMGVFLTLAPVSIFFLLGNTWFSLRCAVFSLWGVAMLCDGILTGLGGLFKRRGREVYAAATCAAMLVFMVASVSELSDYRQTYENDQKALAAIATVYDPDKGNVAFLGLNPSRLEDQNYFYHEHIHGVTESDWALTGGLRERLRGTPITAVTPIRTDAAIKNSYADFSKYDDFYYVDGDYNVYHVTMRYVDDTITFFYDDGYELGYIAVNESGRCTLIIN